MRIRFLHIEDLIIDPYHAAAGSGAGVLRITGTSRIVDVAALREDPKARIITDDAEAVCRILRIPYPNPQVIERK
jgi:hypothetical protein